MLPDWFRPYAGPPSSIQSADGSIFIAQLGSNNGAKDSFRVYVFRIADGVTTEIPLDSGKNHATFSTRLDGTLMLCGEKDGKIREWLIPGFVAPRSADSGIIEEATQLHEPDYVHDELVDELTSAPGLHVRFNKLKRAVLQLRRIAMRRGELR